MRQVSAKIRCRINGIDFTSLVDSGAEINVIDGTFAANSKIKVTFLRYDDIFCKTLA